MRMPTFLLCVCFAVATASLAGVEIRLEIKDVRSSKGQVLVSLFDSKDGFPGDHEKALQSTVLKAATNSLSATFTNLPAGEYAIAICHDENSDGEMNRKLFGPPTEGWAVYKKQKPRMGPPKFEKSSFNVTTADLDVAVQIVYPGD